MNGMSLSTAATGRTRELLTNSDATTPPVPAHAHQAEPDGRQDTNAADMGKRLLAGSKPERFEAKDAVALLAIAGIGFAIVTGSPREWLTVRLLGHGLKQQQAEALAAGLCRSAALSYGMQFINFALSRFSIADNFTGLVEFLPAALIGLARGRTFYPRQVLLTAMLSSWSLRLGLFLLGRMRSRSGPDGRMDALRATSGAVKVGLLGFWIIHGTWVRLRHAMPLHATTELRSSCPFRHS